MLRPNFAIYLGKEKAGGFSGFVADDNLFLIVEIEEGIDVEQGRQMIQKIKDEAAISTINNLATFDQFISQIVTKFNLPTSLTLAAGYFHERVLYLKTVGQGKIFLIRGRDFAQIIDQDNSASGYLEENDFFVFTSKRLIDLLGSDIELKTIFDHKDPHEIVDELTPLLKEKDDEGAIALLVRFIGSQLKQTEIVDVQKQEKVSPVDQIKAKGYSFFESIQSYSQKSSKRKAVTLIAVILILFILIWSVVLGVKRRNEAEAGRKLKSARELIVFKLEQAEEVAFLNLSRSLALVSEAKEEIEKLKKEIADKRKEISEMESLIKETENKIVKKEEKNYEEFYDITLDDKEARGKKLYLDSDNLAIVDNGRGVLYLLSLSKKSLDKKNATKAKQATLIASYQDYFLFYVEGEGVYKISADGKVNKAIDKDSDWGIISDMWIYNGNVYLLDSVVGDIYKYLVAESGYSAKTSYLKTDAGQVKGANSLAIDQSIYVGFEENIIKFTAGERDGFSTSWPEKEVRLTKIFTSAEVEKVYGWDKSKGAIYILGKNGTYERQIDSSILTKATDFVVFNNAAYVLVGEKIYKIGFE